MSTKSNGTVLPEPSVQDSPVPDPSAQDVSFNPRTPSFILVITSVYFAFFLIALDRMIIATAVPAITNSFDSISDIGWYVSQSLALHTFNSSIYTLRT